jgi:putative endonuclease
MAKRRPAKWFLYVLRCADDTFYTGVTNDLERRCRQHNAGSASRYTRGRTPVTLIYQQEFSSRGLAQRHEAHVKALSRRQKEVYIQKTVAPA